MVEQNAAKALEILGLRLRAGAGADRYEGAGERHRNDEAVRRLYLGRWRRGV